MHNQHLSQMSTVVKSRKKSIRKPAYKTNPKVGRKITYYKTQKTNQFSNNRKHFVKRHTDYGVINVSNISGASGSFNFVLSNVPGFAEFTALYDQYKICGVKLIFYPRQTMTNRVDSTENVLGNARIATAIDYNDSSPPLSIDDLRQYESCQITPLIERHERYVDKPLFVNSSGQNVSDWVSSAVIS